MCSMSTYVQTARRIMWGCWKVKPWHFPDQGCELQNINYTTNCSKSTQKQLLPEKSWRTLVELNLSGKFISMWQSSRSATTTIFWSSKTLYFFFYFKSSQLNSSAFDWCLDRNCAWRGSAATQVYVVWDIIKVRLVPSKTPAYGCDSIKLE